MTDPRTPDLDPALRARIADLPAEVMPERDLWGDIRARLDADRVRSIAAPNQAARVRRLPTWAARAAAALVLIAGTATLTRWMSRPATTTVVVLDSAAVAPSTEGLVSYERSAEELTVAFEARAARLDPATVEVLERSMRTIDSAITEARAALARDPASPAIRGYVEAVYRQKIDFLRRANDVARLWEL
ncbi:MAG: hypothetical protein K8S21_06525 [Gemmatimonadetes bacterium]|nr:hypothetical protein [Gemmatimonadota bacterium]